MGILSRFFNRDMNEEALDPLLRSALKHKDLTREEVMSLPPVVSAVDLICNTFAQIPFKLYKEEMKDGKKYTSEVEDKRVSLINEDTKDTLDGFQFKKAICEDYLLGKGGYAYIKRQRNKVLSLHYVKDSKVAIFKNDKNIEKYYELEVDAGRYKSYEFIKLLRNTKDGAKGKGLVEEINKTLQSAYKRIQYDLDLAKTGGSRKGFLKSQRRLDEASLKALKEAWEDYYDGNSNTVVLNEGIEFQEASNSSRENEIALKQDSFAKEMAMLFHIGNSLEDTIKNAVIPIAEAFCVALNRDLLLETEKSTMYFAPDTKELYKGSLKERYEAYSIAIKNGFKTRNEIRYIENDDALKGLDVIDFGLDSVLLNTKTGEIYTPNTNSTVTMGGGE